MLRVLVGCLDLFRGDSVHARAGNASQTLHWKMHVYLLFEGFSELDFLKDTTIVAWKRSGSSRPLCSCSLHAPPHTPTHTQQLPCPRRPPSCPGLRGRRPAPQPAAAPPGRGGDAGQPGRWRQRREGGAWAGGTASGGGAQPLP